MSEQGALVTQSCVTAWPHPAARCGSAGAAPTPPCPKGADRPAPAMWKAGAESAATSSRKSVPEKHLHAMISLHWRWRKKYPLNKQAVKMEEHCPSYSSLEDWQHPRCGTTTLFLLV